MWSSSDVETHISQTVHVSQTSMPGELVRMEDVRRSLYENKYYSLDAQSNKCYTWGQHYRSILGWTCIYFRNIHNAWSRTLFQVINELHCPPMASEGPGIRVLSSKVGIRKVSLWIASSLVTGN